MEELCTAHVATFHRHFVGEKSTPETAWNDEFRHNKGRQNKCQDSVECWKLEAVTATANSWGLSTSTTSMHPEDTLRSFNAGFELALEPASS